MGHHSNLLEVHVVDLESLGLSDLGAAAEAEIQGRYKSSNYQWFLRAKESGYIIWNWTLQHLYGS